MAKQNIFIGRIWPVWPTYARITVGTAPEMEQFQRSEERRVGKEGRSRGVPYHLKKKKKVTCGARVLIKEKLDHDPYIGTVIMISCGEHESTIVAVEGNELRTFTLRVISALEPLSLC